jgi:hypothetical protein
MKSSPLQLMIPETSPMSPFEGGLKGDVSGSVRHHLFSHCEIWEAGIDAISSC